MLSVFRYMDETFGFLKRKKTYERLLSYPVMFNAAMFGDRYFLRSFTMACSSGPLPCYILAAGVIRKPNLVKGI